MKDKQHIFLIGAKGFGTYGGYETFINKLTEYHQDSKEIQYHVACKANGDGSTDEKSLEQVTYVSETEFIYHNAHCFKIHIPDIGAAQAIYYDVAALVECCKMIKTQNIQHPIVYIMACRIGPFAAYFHQKIRKLGGKLYLNPDGHEWMRTKWSKPVRMYWKISERMMVKHSDLLICDSKNIEKYILEVYEKYHPKTTFIAYGAEVGDSKLENTDSTLLEWYQKNELKAREYYLIVGRFVPENNYETMLREFMNSKTSKDLVIITTVNKELQEELERKLQFSRDKRIKFVGTVYNQELLKKIRENAYGYFHGHEVGGTNPSLLEALGSTSLNLLLDVRFNKEVAENTAIYWNKQDGNLSSLIEKADKMTDDEIDNLGAKAKKRILAAYSWEFISNEYYKIFCQ